VVEDEELEAAGGGGHATIHQSCPGERKGGSASLVSVVGFVSGVSSRGRGGELWVEGGGREGGKEG
jgi:hypothetical protein